jgi:hypothetical protein
MSTTYDGTTTVVTASSSPQTLTVADDSRGGVIIANTSTMTLYALLGQGTVSTSLYSYAVPSMKSLEIPFTYVGLVTGIWPTSPDGGANVTVLTT